MCFHMWERPRTPIHMCFQMLERPQGHPGPPRKPQESPQDAPGDPKAPEGPPRVRFDTSFGVYFSMILKTKPDAEVGDGTKSR